MAALTEGRHPGEFILSEASGSRSRDSITIKTGAGVVKAGTVVGKITADGKYWPSHDGIDTGEEGAETAVAVTIYEVDATDADQAVAAITRDAEVNGKVLEYASTVTTDPEKAAKHAELSAVGIIVR
jgi:hypothetical protein